MDISKHLQNISDSLTLKINSKAKSFMKKGKDIINLSAGEPDLDTPEIVRIRAKEAIDKGLTKYTPVSGISPLKRAIAKRYKQRYNVGITEENIIISSGAKQAIFNIISTLCNESDEVMIPTPYWVSYPEMVKLCGAKPVFLPTSKNGYNLDVEEIKKAITKRTKLLILSSPCNPTGVIYSTNSIREMLSLIKENNIFCISDEIYDELIYEDNNYKTALAYSSNLLENLIIVNGVSKTYSMTGWRIGYAIGSPSIINYATKMQGHTTSCASSISQYAALAAYEEAQSFISNMLKIFTERRNLVLKLLQEIDNISFPIPEGGFYFFIDISKFYTERIKTSFEMANYLLENYEIATVPGSAFGDDRCIRLSYTLPLDRLKTGIMRLSEGLSNVRRQG